MNYRGDTFTRVVKAKYQNQQYLFKTGDVIKACFVKKYKNVLYLQKEINITEDGIQSVEIEWTKSEMNTLPLTDYILEIEINTNVFTKTYQEKITIEEDYIR